MARDENANICLVTPDLLVLRDEYVVAGFKTSKLVDRPIRHTEPGVTAWNGQLLKDPASRLPMVMPSPGRPHGSPSRERRKPPNIPALIRTLCSLRAEKEARSCIFQVDHCRSASGKFALAAILGTPRSGTVVAWLQGGMPAKSLGSYY